MVSMLALSVADRVFEPGRFYSKTSKLVFVASPLSMQHLGERAKTCWFEIRIMCPSEGLCLPTGC
jgi:hypothetical protein